MTDSSVTPSAVASPLADGVPFVDRHVGPGADAVARMLGVVGYGSLEDLAAAAVPETIVWTEGLDLPAAGSEAEVAAELRELASRNTVARSMIGLGYHDTHTPPVIRRNVIENPAWYTAYTPYQPEISQGRLEALLNFQTMVGDLTGLPVAGASLLDEPTAAAEAMSLAHRVSKSGCESLRRRRRHPPADPRRARHPRGADRHRDRDHGPRRRPAGRGLLRHAAVVPRLVRPRARLSGAVAAAQARGAVVAVATDLLALTLLTPPGEIGADVVVGSAQRFGVPLGFGGPHAGFMSVRQGLERSLPGRLVGVSVDADGRPAYRLALQTREQHIRREKATCNICTAQVLLAVISAMYAVYHGPDGLTPHRRAHPPARGRPGRRPAPSAA